MGDFQSKFRFREGQSLITTLWKIYKYLTKRGPNQRSKNHPSCRLGYRNLEDFEKHINEEALEIIKSFQASLIKIDWTKEAIHNVMNEVVTSHAIKFPKLAMPLRVLLTGIAQSPSIDAVMAILGRDETMKRLNLYL